MDIRTAVIKYREEESQIRHFHDPVTDTVLDIVGLCIVTQAGFGKIDRTDAAEDMVIDLIGCIEHFLIVGRSSRDIVNSMDQNNIIILAIIVIFNDLIIKLFKNRVVLKLAATELHKEFLCAAFFFLFKREFHIDQVLTNRAG